MKKQELLKRLEAAVADLTHKELKLVVVVAEFYKVEPQLRQQRAKKRD